MHDGVLIVLQHALDHWESFDSWALCKGFDPLHLPSRRLLNAIWAWMTEGMEPERINGLIDVVMQPVVEAPSVKRREERKEDAASKKWRAPAGWKPPGWNEHQSYENAKSFMKFQASPK